MITKFDAIMSLVPEFKGVVRGDAVEWHSPASPTVTDEQIAAELARLIDVWPTRLVGEENYKAMVRRRSEELQAQGLSVDALIMLKTIGE